MSLNAHLNRIFAKPSRAARSPRQTSPLREKVANHPRVWFLDVEPTDGWFVTLRPGWACDHDPSSHCFGASTLTEALKVVKSARPCTCEQCVGEIDKLEGAGT